MCSIRPLRPICVRASAVSLPYHLVFDYIVNCSEYRPLQALGFRKQILPFFPRCRGRRSGILLLVFFYFFLIASTFRPKRKPLEKSCRYSDASRPSTPFASEKSIEIFLSWLNKVHSKAQRKQNTQNNGKTFVINLTGWFRWRPRICVTSEFRFASLTFCTVVVVVVVVCIRSDRCSLVRWVKPNVRITRACC